VLNDSVGGKCIVSGLRVCWASDVGCIREANEDACLASAEENLILVSDGMGGEHAGGLASSLVVQWLPELVAEHVGQLENPDEKDVELGLRDAVLELNHRMRQESSCFGIANKMGATVAMALVRNPQVHLAHMGDSLAFLFRDGKLELLTPDHSVIGILLSRGAITPEQAVGHPMKGQLSRYVGMGGNAGPDLRTVRLRQGDWLLLCTDGLTEHLDPARIEGMLGECDDTEDACRRLIEAARADGGRDNVTVMIAEKAEP